MEKLDHLSMQFLPYTIGVALVLIAFLSSCLEDGKSLLVTTNQDENFTHFYAGNKGKLYKYRLRRDESYPLDVVYKINVVDEFEIGNDVQASPYLTIFKRTSQLSGTAEKDINIYMAGDNGKVYRFIDNDMDNNNLTILWEFDVGAPITSSVYHQYKFFNLDISSFFYVGTTNGEFFCLDDNGTEQWKFATESGAAIHSTATGKRVVEPPGITSSIFFGADDGYLYALNGDTGQEEWKFYTEGAVKSSPLINPSNPEVIIVGSDNGMVYGLNDQSGGIVWQFETEGAVRSSPTHFDNSIYIGSDDGKLYALNGSSGQKLWEYQTGGPVKSTPYAFETDIERIFVGSEDGYVYSLRNDGTLIWEKDLEAGPITSSPVSDAHRVYVNTPAGVYVLDLSTGVLIDRFSVSNNGSAKSSVSIINYRYNTEFQEYHKGEYSPNIHGSK